MSKRPSAWIASSKDNGRKSVKKIGSKDTVYLKNEEEFVIELFNPMKFCVLADIKLNGNSISNSGIVLNPGQRFYLDCYIDSGRKFKFKTYDVENTKEVLDAISENGVLEVKFYKETIKNINCWGRIGTLTNRSIWYDRYSYPNTFYNSSPSLTGNPNYTTTFTTNSVDNLILCSASIETGRVEKGDASNQKFETVDMDFDSYAISTTKVYILPESRKPIETKEVQKESLNVIDMIQKLADLHKSGILTDDEFNSKKSELLSRI